MLGRVCPCQQQRALGEGVLGRPQCRFLDSFRHLCLKICSPGGHFPLSRQWLVLINAQLNIYQLLFYFLTGLKHQPNNMHLPPLNKGLNFTKIGQFFEKPHRRPWMCGLKLPERAPEGSHMDPGTQGRKMLQVVHF